MYIPCCSFAFFIKTPTHNYYSFTFFHYILCKFYVKRMTKKAKNSKFELLF